jgi:putative membrane protein
MIALLAVHIMALICWAGSLLYLPAVIAVTTPREAHVKHDAPLSRKLYTLVITPAAFIAIMSGTALFLVKQLVAGWLVAKLALVSGLVLCHLLNGWMIARVEQDPERRVSLYCTLLGVVSAVFITGIIWLVLAKPF